MKKILLALLAILLAFALSGCQENKDYSSVLLWDSKGYNYAIIKLQNGELIEGPIEKWRDFEDGEQLEVTIDGVLYLTNSINCTLIHK